MLVAEVMSRRLERVHPADSIQSTAQRMREQDIGMVLVEERGEIRGVVTDRDITCRSVAQGLPADTAVEQCMSKEPISCYTDDDLYQAVELMEREQVRRLLVRNRDGTPVGVLAQADVVEGIAPYGLAGEMVGAISRPGGRHRQH